jgi:hypothetical protein
MKRPAFQFYPKDWSGNQKLRRCSEAARGAWINILCTLHDSEEYGVVRFPLVELVDAAGVKMKSAQELVAKGVLKGSDTEISAYVYTPSHAGKKLDPVTLIHAGAGPVWFSSRMVRDEWIRGRRGEHTRFSTDHQPSGGVTPKAAPTRSPKPHIGTRQGDGSAVASAVAVPVTTAFPVLDTSRPEEPTAKSAGEAQGDPNPEVQRRRPGMVNLLRKHRVTGVEEHPLIVDRILATAKDEHIVAAFGEAARSKGGQPYDIGFLDAIVARISKADREASERVRGAADARVAETARRAEEQRAWENTPMPDHVRAQLPRKAAEA